MFTSKQATAREADHGKGVLNGGSTDDNDTDIHHNIIWTRLDSRVPQCRSRAGMQNPVSVHGAHAVSA